MPNLYLTEQGSILRKTGDRLLVEKNKEIMLDVQCHKIETVLIFGNVQFTTQAVHELFQHNIELALFTMNGKLVGQLTPIMPKNIEIRMAQYKRHNEPEFILSISKAIINGKLNNCIEHVKRFEYYHKDIDLSAQVGKLQESVLSIENHNTSDGLLGLEGTAAKIYFNALGKMIINEKFSFSGRIKHPAPDPVNARLSFGYTLLFNEINSLVDGLGFDPYIGFLHKIEYGRPSLACDMIETFRAPVVDRFTLSIINSGTISTDDFYTHTASGGMYLKREALKKYLAKYEQFMQQEFEHSEIEGKANFRKAIRYHASQMAKAVSDGSIYKPLIFAK